MKNTEDQKYKKATNNKFAREIRSNKDKADKETLGYSNYFKAQKVRSDVSKAEEEEGKKILLNAQTDTKKRKNTATVYEKEDNNEE